MIVQRPAETSFARFSAGEKLLLTGEIAATYVRTKLMLRNRKIDEVVAEARRPLAPDAPDAAPEVLWFSLRLGRVVERLLERLPGDTRCLTRSVVLLQMLARRRIRSTLVIGVRPAPSFAAHAWVELDGKPLLSPIEYGEGRLVEL